MHTLGLPPGNELVLFAMARTVGWIAHASEQLRHGGLIRPRARYIGPAPGRGTPGQSRHDRAAAVAAADDPDRKREISAPPSTASIHRCLPLCS